jgi:hypothetical protein
VNETSEVRDKVKTGMTDGGECNAVMANGQGEPERILPERRNAVMLPV